MPFPSRGAAWGPIPVFPPPGETSRRAGRRCRRCCRVRAGPPAAGGHGRHPRPGPRRAGPHGQGVPRRRVALWLHMGGVRVGLVGSVAGVSDAAGAGKLPRACLKKCPYPPPPNPKFCRDCSPRARRIRPPPGRYVLHALTSDRRRDCQQVRQLSLVQ
jgi:hypothetical protein